MEANGSAVEQRIFFLDLPSECIVEVLGSLSASELATAAQCCKALASLCNADSLWRSLCVKERHGAHLDFTQRLGRFCHPCARPLPGAEAESGQTSSPCHDAEGPPVAPPESGWRAVYRRSKESMASTICVDTGRGYAKYGMADGAPAKIQICEPRAEASQQTLYTHVFRRLGLKRPQLAQMALIVAEPFRLAAHEHARELEAWRFETQKRILQAYKLHRLCIVDSASLCLFANKRTSGVVVNIGFALTFVVPVVRGHIVRRAVRTVRIGGAALTQFYSSILDRLGVEPSANSSLPHITAARNLKEVSCEAWPTTLEEHLGHSPFALSQLLTRDDAPVFSTTVDDEEIRLGWERFLPAELLFAPSAAGIGGGGIQHAVLAAVEAAAADEACDGVSGLKKQLLGRVVLSGGSAQMPKLPERLQFEIKTLLARQLGSQLNVKVMPSLEGDHTTWFGASVLAGTSTFAEHWCVHAPTAPNLSGLDDGKHELSSPDDDDDDDEEDEEEDDDDGNGQGDEEGEERDGEADGNQDAAGGDDEVEKESDTGVGAGDDGGVEDSHAAGGGDGDGEGGGGNSESAGGAAPVPTMRARCQTGVGGTAAARAALADELD
mmetsp:Transcript_12232/g.26422  ORF Transcript_12232/g.26422 Transcript_12232/m.26422 type:complete len:608 (-) Transcript_12232:466-2289(-)